MIEDLLPSLYAAPTPGWQPFLEALRQRLRAAQTILGFHDVREGIVRSVVRHAGISAEQEAGYRACWMAEDPWLTRTPPAAVGVVRPGHDLCPDEVLEQ